MSFGTAFLLYQVGLYCIVHSVWAIRTARRLWPDPAPRPTLAVVAARAAKAASGRGPRTSALSVNAEIRREARQHGALRRGIVADAAAHVCGALVITSVLAAAAAGALHDRPEHLLTACLGALLYLAIALFASIAALNRPRFLIPPHLRGDRPKVLLFATYVVTRGRPWRRRARFGSRDTEDLLFDLPSRRDRRAARNADRTQFRRRYRRPS